MMQKTRWNATRTEIRVISGEGWEIGVNSSSIVPDDDDSQ